MKLRLIIACTGLLLLVFISAGSFVAFQVLRSQIHTEMKELIRSGASGKQITELKLSVNDLTSLQWMNEDEFVYEGNFYDLVSSKTESEHVIMKVVNDGKEKKLFGGMKLFSGSPSHSKNKLDDLSKFLNLKYLGTQSELLSNECSRYVYPRLSDSSLPLVTADLSTPPPRF